MKTAALSLLFALSALPGLAMAEGPSNWDQAFPLEKNAPEWQTNIGFTEALGGGYAGVVGLIKSSKGDIKALMQVPARKLARENLAKADAVDRGLFEAEAEVKSKGRVLSAEEISQLAELNKKVDEKAAIYVEATLAGKLISKPITMEMEKAASFGKFAGVGSVVLLADGGLRMITNINKRDPGYSPLVGAVVQSAKSMKAKMTPEVDHSLVDTGMDDTK